MKRFAIVIALLLGCVPADGSLRLRGSSGEDPPPPSAPILNSVAVNFGEYTRNGGGGVRLSSMDDLTSYGLPVYGLGLQDPDGTPCATWTVTKVSGTSTHFNVVTAQAEGTSAITPVPSGTGVSAHLNGGPYVFNVNCTDANGNASNTATLTYNIVEDAATVDEFLGNFPDVTSGYASFASTEGYKLLVPTGFKKLGAVGWGIVCPVECTMTWADTDRPGLMQRFAPLSTKNTKLRIKDMQFTGDASVGTVLEFTANTAGTNTIALENVTVQFKPQATTNNPLTAFSSRWKGAPGWSIQNYKANWVGLGMRIYGDDFRIKDVTLSNFSTNCIGTDANEILVMEDVMCYNPQVAVGGYHVDCWQIGNGSTVKDFDIKRSSCLTAGGHGLPQGPVFPGHTTIGRGYISNGSGGAGNNVVLIAPNDDPNKFFTPEAVGSQLFAPDCIDPSENVRVTASNLNNTATIDGSARLCGSAASPIDIAAYTGENMNFRGMVHTGNSGWGMASHEDHGTGGMQNFAYIGHVPINQYKTFAVCDFSGTTMTCQGPTTSNAVYNAGIAACGSGCGYVGTYPGIVGGSFNITNRTAGSTYCNLPTDTICSYTISRNLGTVNGVTVSAVPPVGIANVASMVPVQQLSPDEDWLHTGTQTYENGYSYAGMVWPLGGGSYQAFPPVNTTVSNVWNYTTAPPADAFDLGDPKANLEAITQEAWDAMTPAEVLATHCEILMPKAAGPLDNGDGTWASPFRPDTDMDGNGEWYDGTNIVGCN